MVLLIFFIFSLAYSDDLNNQNQEILFITPKVGILSNLHFSNFSSFQGSIDCDIFKNGLGTGFLASLGIEYKVNRDIGYGLNFQLLDKSAKLTVNSGFPSRNPNTGEVIYVETENSLTANPLFIDLKPYLCYTLTDNLISGPLISYFSVFVGLPVSSKFKQSEQIISPDYAVFITNNKRTRERLLIEGQIEKIAKLEYGFSFGFQNSLKVGKNTYLTQEIFFDVALNNLSTDVNWKVFSIGLALGLKIPFFTKQYKIDTIPKVEPDVKLIAKEEKTPKLPYNEPYVGIEIDSVTGEIQYGSELLASLPIVNSVFFKRNSFEIEDFYIINKTKNPNEYKKMVLPSLFKGDVIEIQSYNILRIVSILNKNPNSTITIEGYTSGPKFETEGLSLAQKRAESVKKAFINWGIPESRITTSASIRPPIPSNQDFSEGIDENQRADIILKNAPLQEYVAFQRFTQFIGNAFIKVDYENIDLNKPIYVTNNFSDSVLDIKNKGEFIIPLKKRLEPNENINFLSFTINYDTLKMMKNKLIDYLKYPKREIELILNNFEAILRFDYDKSNLSEDNKNLLKQLCNILPDGCTIQLIGSTDALGTENRNIKLADERAKNAELFIKSIAKNKFKIEIMKKINKFPESTPFGRFLNRSIRIKVKK
ncbi:MAG: OmpA family protein [Candidatus Kapabacteria bacterium]|nr:OmpA family protein [Candidatus Kapabacteria bacterium]